MLMKKLEANLVLYKVASLVSALYLCFYYRQGGLKDAGISVPGPRDAGVYIATGRAILEGVNPYTTIGNRFGTVGVIPIGLLSYIVPSNLHTLLIQTLNLIGIYYFLVVVSQLYDKTNVYLVFLTTLFLAPTREMLATNQITGILMGLLAGGFSAFLKYQINSIQKYIYISGTLFAISIDLKPHIAGIFILLLCITYRNVILAIVTSAFIVLTHLIVDLSQHRILERDWINVLKALQDRSTTGTLGDSVSFWPIIYKIARINGLPSTVTTITMLLVLCGSIFVALNGNFTKVIALSFLVPSLGIYFHYYDAIPFFSITLLYLAAKRKVSLAALIFLGFTLVPIEFQIPKNQILVIAFIILWTSGSKLLKRIQLTLLSVAFINLIHLANLRLTDNQYFTQSLIVTESIVFGTYVILKRTNNMSSNKRQDSIYNS